MPTAVRRRLLIMIGVVIVLLVLAGATYQGVATALERRRYPHPGRLIDVGGHQLHIDCSGQGTPTVVLEAPATAMASAWAWVQTDVATITRVCSYDRAGLGWSESGDAPFAPQAVPPELNALLMRAAERPPYVITGAEFGAALATLYASRYPADVATLIVVNPPAPFSNRTTSTPSAEFVTFSPWLARTGLLRATRTLSASAGELPPSAAGVVRAFLNRPDHLARSAGELARWDDTVMLGEAAALPRDLPVIQLEVEGNDRIGLLANRRNARDVSDAIANAIKRVRSRRDGGAP